MENDLDENIQSKEECLGNWFKTFLKDWLLQYNLRVEIISSTKENFRFSISGLDKINEYTLSSEDIEELHSQIKINKSLCIENKLNIDYIFKISDHNYITFVSSSTDKTLNLFNLKGFLNKEENISVNIELTKNLSYSLIYLLVQNNFTTIFNDKNFKEGLDFTEIFEVTYLDFCIKDTMISNNDLIVQLVISLIFELNQIFSSTLYPTRIIDKNIMNLSNMSQEAEYIKMGEGKVRKEKTHHSLLYDTQALLYYFAGMRNEDLRFKYIDYYHVLEYFFSRIVLYRASIIIKDTLKNPSIFYEELKIHEFAERIKDEIIGDNKKEEFREKEILKKIVKEFVSSISFNEFIKDQPELKKISKDFQSLKMEKNDSNFIQTLSDRIYKIRNAIFHSNKDISPRISPNSEELIYFDQEVNLLKNISDFLIRKFSKNFSNPCSL